MPQKNLQDSHAFTTPDASENSSSTENETLEVFVLMPYGANDEYSGGVEESNFVYDEIIHIGVQEAAKRHDRAFIIRREVDRNRAGSITRSLISSLVKADVVVVDLTGKNANVFFELGIRYSLREKITILMAREGTEIPFDIRGYRYIPYSIFRPREARMKILEYIGEALLDQTYSDSLVFETFPTLTVNIPNVFESRGISARRQDSVMPWDEYLDRIKFHSSYLKPAVEDKRFFPDAVIGITNGGMVAADILAKATLGASSIPVVTLWARRYEPSDSPNAYFDNQFNKAVISVISKMHRENAKILLVDDHLGTGLTAQQAINYLESNLKNPKIVFVPIVSRRIKLIKELVGKHFPYKFKEFRVTEKEFIDRVSTNYQSLPYLGKEINRSSSGTN